MIEREEIPLFPDPSPDQSEVAYQRMSGYEWRLYVFNRATRTTTQLPFAGQTPRWSPDGTLIAYVTDQLRVVRPDGSDDRALVPTGERFGLFFDWSPDGEYIVAPGFSGRVSVVVVATGEVMPLAFTLGKEYQRLGWRR